MMELFKGKTKRELILSNLKTILVYVIVVISCISISNGFDIYFRRAVLGVIELTAVILFTKIFEKKVYPLAYVLNGLLTFVVLLQSLIYKFTNAFATKILIGNLGTAKSLGMKSIIYGVMIVLILVICFLPLSMEKLIPLPLKISLPLGLIGVVYLAFAITGSLSGKVSLSPVGSFIDVANEISGASALEREIMANETDGKAYEKDSSEDAIVKPSNLQDKPNIIVFWTEGMSKEVINSSRKDLMPNLLKMQEESISFDRYYNHTAATYRGLRGQMISGYQLPDGSEDKFEFKKDIPSLQSVLKNYGYTTTFFNPEPALAPFTSYLNNLGYDKVTPLKTDDYIMEAFNKNVTDKGAFDLLKKEITNSADDTPFFMGMYNFGTHLGENSLEVGVQYGDGKDLVLNRFYNWDYQFGEFFKWLKSSKYGKNTIVVMTTDHASYKAPEYTNAFGSAQPEMFVGEIPLYIWYDGVKSQHIDVAGRNSLGFTPTLLDFLDLEADKNYFLGNSMFQTEKVSEFETLSVMARDYFVTKDGNVGKIDLDIDGQTYIDINSYYAFTMVNKDKPTSIREG